MRVQFCSIETASWLIAAVLEGAPDLSLCIVLCIAFDNDSRCPGGGRAELFGHTIRGRNHGNVKMGFYGLDTLVIGHVLLLRSLLLSPLLSMQTFRPDRLPLQQGPPQVELVNQSESPGRVSPEKHDGIAVTQT